MILPSAKGYELRAASFEQSGAIQMKLAERKYDFDRTPEPFS
jgi:hypothetical protein